MTDQAAPASPKTGAAPTHAPQGAVEKTRAAANMALDRTLDGARHAADSTAKAIDSNPLPILAGGLVLGAIAGALLPRSDRETQLLAPVGRKIRSTTTEAIGSAKQTGLAELGALGLSKSAFSDQAGKLVGGVLTALATAGTAAINASRDGGGKKPE